jgi:uncharacterized SAM-binding protein YcdF (DUF218 family)
VSWRQRVVTFAVRRKTVWKTTWRFRLLLVVLLLIVTAASGRFVLTTAGAALVQRDALQPADAILVDVTISPSLSAMRQAAQLEHGGYAPKVLFTRYVPTDRLERAGLQVPRDFDAVIRVYAEDAGLPLATVETIPIEVQDPVTLNTARQVAAYCQARGIRSLILVEALFHSRRSALTYARFLTPLGIRLMSQPIESGLQVSNWWRTKDGWLSVVEESVKLAYYRAFVL